MPNLSPTTSSCARERPASANLTVNQNLRPARTRTVLQRRHLALHVPQLPLDRWHRRDDPRLSGPFAVTATSKGAERLICVNDQAAHASVRPGQSLTDATAVCPNLLTEPQHILREARLLASLHRWADKFSPRVSIAEPDGLALDISGCAHLFEGERQLADVMLEELSDLKITARIGVANTKTAARGFARFGSSQVTVSDPTRESEQVGRLPLDALDLDASAYADLRRLGVKTIADLSRFKSSELARRFSVRLPLALDALRGHRPDPVVPTATPLIFAAQMTLPEPIGHIDAVTNVLRRMSERVCTRLHEKQQAARGFQLSVRCVDTGEQSLSIGFSSPARDPKAILRQFQRPLDDLSLPFGADWFRLLALDTQIFKPVQIVIGDETAHTQAALEQTLATLGNRLGFDRVRRPINHPSHAPEREHGSLEAVDADKRTRPSAYPSARHVHPRPELAFRPERLHIIKPGRPPRDFQWRHDRFQLSSADGPERVSPIWWDAPDNWLAGELRDYWRVTTNAGRRFWLLTCPRQPDLGWFCAGEFL